MKNKTFFIVKHEVADFETWKKAYDADEDRRQVAGIQMVSLMRDSENPNMIILLGEGKDKDAVEAFVSNPELKEVMTAAGVISAPDISIHSLGESDEQVSGKAIMLLSHEVADFEAWKPVYDEHGSVRTAHSVNVAYLLRDVNNENMVTLIARAPGLENIHSFIGNPSLAEAMKNAGVISQPEISLLLN